MISIIHPSRGRPKLANATASRWVERAGTAVEYILSLDYDDPMLRDYGPTFTVDVPYKSVTSANESAIEAINRAATYAKGEILVVISDDFSCPENWGQKIEEMMIMRKDWILKTQDGIQDWVITLPLMDRAYYERFGYIYHPDYKHAWCDTEMTYVAELLDRKYTSMLRFTHHHYSAGGTFDKTYERADKWFEQGRRVFQERVNKNFDLTPDQIKGRVKDNYYSRMKQ